MPVDMLRPPLSSTLPIEIRRSRRPFFLPGRASWSSMPLPTSLFHISILVVLVACSALLHTTSRSTISPTRAPQCVSRDMANPIASMFPNNATGVLNATLAIVPIPLQTARRLIPAQYGILEQAYRSILPDFPAGMYPLLVQAAHDHDVQLKSFGITLDDFSRVGLEFPFVDLLDDGYSSFRWAPAQLITADHEIALRGSMAYGTEVFPAAFEPACDAYQAGVSTIAATSTFFRARSRDGIAYAEIEMWRSEAAGVRKPYSIEAFRNITNQPTFANGSSCDNMIRLFNSSMSLGEEHEPVFVRGTVRANVRPLEGEAEWKGVYGVQVATPFIENNYLDCAAMKGYAGTGGPGDSDLKINGRGLG